jgi:hypothetical protein
MRYELHCKGHKICSQNIDYLRTRAKTITLQWEIYVIMPSKMRDKEFGLFGDSTMKTILEEIGRGYSIKILSKKYLCTQYMLGAQIHRYKKNLAV